MGQFNPFGMTPAQIAQAAQGAATSGQQVSGLNLGSSSGGGGGGGSIVSSEGVDAVTALLSVLYGADNAQKMLDQAAKQYESDLKFKYYQLNKQADTALAEARISSGSQRDTALITAETARANAELAAQTSLEIAQMDDKTRRDIAAAELAQEFNRLSAEEFGSPSAWIKQMRFMQGQGQAGERAGLTLKAPTLGGTPLSAPAGATTTAGAGMPVASQALVGEPTASGQPRPEVATALPGGGTMITPLAGGQAVSKLPEWAKRLPRMQAGGAVTNDTYGQWTRDWAKTAGGPATTPAGWDKWRASHGLVPMKTIYEPYAAGVAGQLDVTRPMPVASSVARGPGTYINPRQYAGANTSLTQRPVGAGQLAAMRTPAYQAALHGSVGGGMPTAGGRFSEEGGMGGGKPWGRAAIGKGWGTYVPGAKWVTGKGWVAPPAAAVPGAPAAGAPAATPALTPEQQQVANLPLWARGKAGGQYGLWENWTGPRTIPEVGLNEPITLPYEFDYRQWAQLTPAQKQMWLGTWEALGYFPDDALAILEGSAVTGTAGPMTGWG